MRLQFLYTLVIFILAGCVSTGFSMPKINNTNRQAESNPSQLIPQGAVYKNQASNTNDNFENAGLDFVQNDQESLDQHQTVRSESPLVAQQNLSAPQEKFKIALLVPLSGEHSNLGLALLQASQLALFDLKFNDFELIPRDTKGTAEGARQAARSAVEAGAQLVMGPLFSSSVRAVKPIFRRTRTNMLAFSTDWTLADNQTFIMGFLPFSQVQRITEYAHINGYEKIGILSPNTDYGNAVIAAYHSYAFRNQLPTPEVMKFPTDGSDISVPIKLFSKFDERQKALQDKIIELEEALTNEPDNKSLKKEIEELSKLDTYGELPYDAILLPVGGDYARSVSNMLSLYDLTPDQVKRLGTGLWDDKGLNSEPGLEKAWYATPSSSLRDSFVSKYKDSFGQYPPRIASLAYDSTALAVILAKKYRGYGQITDVFNRQAITNPNGFSGIDGIFRFHPDGLIERGQAVMEINRSGVKIIDAAPQTFERYNLHNTSN